MKNGLVKLVGMKMLGEAKEVTDEYRVGKVIRAKQ
jgi:hypothetical protein